MCFHVEIRQIYFGFVEIYHVHNHHVDFFTKFRIVFFEMIFGYILKYEALEILNYYAFQSDNLTV